jgi:hypothetical protein
MIGVRFDVGLDALRAAGLFGFFTIEFLPG